MPRNSKKKKQSEVRTLRLDVLPVRFGLHNAERVKYPAETTDEAKARVGEACNTVRTYIRKYRLAIRKACAPLLFAQAATEEWSDEKGRAVIGKADAVTEEMSKLTGDKVCIQRNLDRFVKALIPTLKCECFQQVANRIYTAITAKDPDIPISRHLLILDGVRKLPWFMNEPIHLKYCPTYRSDVIFNGHRVFLRWDKELGYVEFKLIGKKLKQNAKGNSKRGLDASQWYIIKQLQSGAWAPGGAKLQLMKDGDFRLICGYQGFELDRPELRAKAGRERIELIPVDKDRIDELSFTEDRERFMVLQLSSGHRASAGIPVDEVKKHEWSALGMLAHVDRLSKQQDRSKKRASSCGAFHKAREAEQTRRDRITRARENVVANWAHEWSLQVADRCMSMRCGQLRVFDIPKEVLFLRPFPWSKFRFDLEYKCRERGIEVSYHESPKDSSGSSDPNAEDSATASVDGQE